MEKYRIIYNEEKVICITEDAGACYLADQHLMMVETLEDARVMLQAIGVDTTELDQYQNG